MNKPYILLNSAMTLDGKIAPENDNLIISNEKDLIRVHKIRKEYDGIMVGINTVLIDDPKLTVHKISSKKSDNPIRIIIDSYARIPLDAKVLKDDANTIVAVSKKASNYKIHQLNEKCEIIKCGENKVDLIKLMDILFKQGIETVLLEGGSTLNFAMLKSQLIDKISVCIGSKILGGKSSKTLIDGEGFNKEKCVSLKLDNYYPLDDTIVLEYTVNY